MGSYVRLLVLILVIGSSIAEEETSLIKNTTEYMAEEGSGVILTQQQTTTSPKKNIVMRRKSLKCTFQGRKKSYLKNREHELACCEYTVGRYARRWFNGGNYLTTYFDKLVVWNCPQLKQECINQTYVFSEYARLMYAYNCKNQSLLEDECKSVLRPLLSNSSNTISWNEMINNLSPSELRSEELAKPCVQVALYGSKYGGFGFYHEVIDVFIPFCELTWGGFVSQTVEERSVSTWTCMPLRCRANVIISSIVCGLLAAAIVLANVTVIFVFCSRPKLRNSQAVYKISLAIADLLVGVIVIPTFISSLLILFKSRTSMGAVIPNMKPNSLGNSPRFSGAHFDERFTTEYMGFIGFFTTVSLLVSIYTLMMASFDRFMAIYMPLRYGRHNAKKMAIWASLILWLTGIIFSVLPYFVPGLKYGLIASILVASSGESALYLYTVAILIPLVVVWLTTLSTYLSTKKHARKREALTIRRSISNSSKITSMETRLARTLASMVGIFTLCLLPTLIVMISAMFISNIYHVIPKSFSVQASAIVVSFEFVATLIMMTNSLWNCFIYNARNEEFKTTAKEMYVQILRRLGVNLLWRKTRSFANSTMRSRQSTMTTSVGLRSTKLNKKISVTTLRTTSNNDANMNGHTTNTLTMEPIKLHNKNGNCNQMNGDACSPTDVTLKIAYDNPAMEQEKGEIVIEQSHDVKKEDIQTDTV